MKIKHKIRYLMFISNHMFWISRRGNYVMIINFMILSESMYNENFVLLRQLGIPHQETVILFNRDHNKTIQLLSISGNTRHFHASFFRNKVSFS